MNLKRRMELGSDFQSAQVQAQLFPLYEGLCNPLSSLELTGTTIKIPAVAPTFFGVPSVSIQPFTFTYSISLEVNVQGKICCSSEIPVLISALPPKQDHLNLYSSKGPNHGTIDIESLSITEDTRCDLVSSKSRLEEGDKIITGIDHNHNIYDLQGNSIGQNSRVNPFRPNVLVSYSRLEVNSSHETHETSHLNHESAIAEIMKFLEKELDSHGVISDWIKEHPTIMDEISPEEILKIFQNLKHPVYIPCVAREIGHHSNKLTTMHVRKIIDAFPTFKTQVAKAMLPYVIDPQCSDDILSLLNVS
jgi:hypothetical protein